MSAKTVERVDAEIYRTRWNVLGEIIIRLIAAGLVARFGVFMMSTGSMQTGWIAIIVSVLSFVGSVALASKKSVVVTKRNLVIEADDKTEFIAIDTITSVATRPMSVIIGTTQGKKPVTVDVPKPGQLASAIAYARSGSKGPSPFPPPSGADTGEMSKNTKWTVGTVLAMVFGYFVMIIPGAMREGYAIGDDNPKQEVVTLDQMKTPEGRRLAFCVNRTKEGIPTKGETHAYIYAKVFIQSQLKAPASSKWPDMEEPAVTSYHTGTPCVFKVRGRVDSQNGFGAMIRSYYEVVAKYDPVAGRFTVEDFSMH